MTTPTIDRPEQGGTKPEREIDPRILARRVAVRRDEGRKRLHRLIALGIVAALLASAYLITRSPLLDVDRVVVTGNTHTPTAALVQGTGIENHQAMTDVDLALARRQLLALPWVQSVSVRRSWPGTVAVVVVERTAVAAIASAQGGFAVVDGTGRVLEVDPDVPPGMVTLDGVPAPGAPGSSLDPAAADALRVAVALTPTLVAQIGSVVVAATGVVLALREGGSVVLGSTDDLAAKLIAASTMLTQVDLGDLCSIDVRVPSAPSLTRGSACL